MAKAAKSSPEPERSLTDTFRQRMIEEQEVRGYTDAGLAHRASQFHPVAANTIWQIQKRGRRVDIDEADAIARAFDFSDVRTFVETRPEYAHFRETYWNLFRELAKLLPGESMDPKRPFTAVKFLSDQLTVERSPAQWGQILATPFPNDSLASPAVMLRDLQSDIQQVRMQVDDLLDGMSADLDRTARSLQAAEEGATK